MVQEAAQSKDNLPHPTQTSLPLFLETVHLQNIGKHKLPSAMVQGVLAWSHEASSSHAMAKSKSVPCNNPPPFLNARKIRGDFAPPNEATSQAAPVPTWCLQE